MAFRNSRWDGYPDSNGNINQPYNAQYDTQVDPVVPIQSAGYLPSTNNDGYGDSYGNNGGQADGTSEGGVFGSTMGRFVGSRPDSTNANSDYLECVYEPIRPEQDRVLLLCEKKAGCCTDACCPVDPQWMAGVYVLIAFVIVVAVVGFAAAIVCYQRSKSKSRKEQYMQDGYASSQVGSQLGYPYGSSFGPPSAKY